MKSTDTDVRALTEKLTENTSPLRLGREPPPARASLPRPSSPPVLPRRFVLRFLTGPRAGQEQEVVIDPARELVFGRRDAEVTLAEDLVSRRHARLAVEDGRLVLTDLGSTNGTFVNGERISRVELRLGDRLILGNTIVRLVDRERAEGLPLTVEREATPKAASTMTGRLEEVPVVDLLQLFSNGRKTGTLSLHADEDGEVGLRAGRLAHVVLASRPQLSPRKALARVLRWTSGAFEFAPAPPDETALPPELDESTEMLLIDALRQNDELAAIAARLPRAETILTLARRFPGPLRALDGDALEVLQLVHERGMFSAVLDYATLADVDVARVLLRLLRLGWVEVRA